MIVSKTSMKLKNLCPAEESTCRSMEGKGKLSLGQALFKLLGLMSWALLWAVCLMGLAGLTYDKPFFCLAGHYNDCHICIRYTAKENAFEALKRVLADIPNSKRFDILKALITNSDSSSMVAIILDLVRGEMHTESTLRISIGKNEVLEADNKACQNTLFWSTSILELVESVLRPVKGGPPVLPENGDAVLSALNLYRFVLMTESAGKTDYTGVLSKNNLQKADNEWLLPLRMLVTGIMAENKSDNDQLAADTICTLNSVELVLYRCFELEEKLKHSA